ncbi:FecCD family ABC transporter permease [Pseudactinotalea sp. HY160]|uniref:FecCD family ABC transporter permease n=1 Tax=Pseudactinotalea sp. HY160 TaxID=2654490 RepID=UPI00351B4FB1
MITAPDAPETLAAREPARPGPARGVGGVRANRRGLRAAIVGSVLTVGLLATLVASATIGQFDTTLGEVVDSLVRVLTGAASPSESRLDAALWAIRFPRALLAMIVGACLAVAGAVMQGVFANPLAEPSIVGVSSGASVGAAVVIVFGLTAVTPAALPIAAFLGALVVTLAVWALARTGGKAAVLTLVLTGIAINAIATAATSFLIFLGDTSSREQVIFWQLGTLSDARWSSVAITGGVFAVAFAGCLLVRGNLDVLALGDTSAATSGVPVERLRVIAILLVCLLTGVAVAFSGVIAFVGLIVPHALRLLVGPSHRYLVPLSALGGAVLLSLADIVARTIIPFGDLPIGIFTAVVGGPLFLVLLRRTLRGQGVRA